MNDGEDFRNSHVSEIAEGGRSYRIALPDRATDYIQKKIAETQHPYEPDMLQDMAGRLSPGDLVLDVGANIGNHSLYLAAVAGCCVTAFEPNAHLAAALRHSAGLNDVGARLHVLAKGVADAPGKAAFAENIAENLGAQSLTQGAGEIDVIALDSIRFSTPVRMLKIDVEGMEMAVLRGAHALIARDRPLIYVECMDRAAFDEVQALLAEAGYLVAGMFNATPTLLFLPGDRMPSIEELQQPMLRILAETYRYRAEAAKNKAALEAGNLKYRNATTQLRDLRVEAGRAREAAVPLRRRPRPPAARGLSEEAQKAGWILFHAQGRRVLDIAGAAVDLPLQLAREGLEVVCITPDKAAVARGRATLADAPEALRTRVRLAVADLGRAPRDAPFDTVLLRGTLTGAANPARIVDMAMACLAPRGRLILTVPFGRTNTDSGPHEGIFPGALCRMLAEFGSIGAVDIIGGDILATLERPGPEALPEVTPQELLELGETAMRRHEAALLRRIAAAR